ncbi:hypothetical protein CHH28_02455 [Bacterioplanes sanyensis]|uniref:Uncharacterized protein n=1 Tax=Bacterioplanes sanyensis TaxID=1249553 RepID=A0A222FFQ3_9GAMM|nr:hypothetical protein [Bacterioplanes sanyensis]ASP37600.1 hypothetical protein CHH28_02455 [Bacterioplanes sanyensis]
MKAIATLFTALAISACSPATEEQENTDLLKGQHEALEKAKQVEVLLQDADEKRRQQLQHSE